LKHIDKNNNHGELSNVHLGEKTLKNPPTFHINIKPQKASPKLWGHQSNKKGGGGGGPVQQERLPLRRKKVVVEALRGSKSSKIQKTTGANVGFPSEEPTRR